jgi:hypothetical protein
MENVPEEHYRTRPLAAQALEGGEEIVGVAVDLAQVSIREDGDLPGGDVERDRITRHGEGILVSGLALLLAAGAAVARPVVAPEVEAAMAAQAEARVVVTLRDGALAGRAERERLAGTLGGLRSLANAPVLSGRLDAAALDALRRRPDVESVALDRVVRPAGQIGPVQIGVDRLIGAGLAGNGRSIAIVDSGVDALHPDLGGAPAPNAKVWGGWNAVEENDDITDCSGHGTAVAGIAAGSDGVAPGAGIVALKVFGGPAGCGAATLSDVLAAVDWTVSNARRLKIDVINLSLADDTLHAGFCDNDEPASARIFASARRAGLAVVAASGNGGRADALAWPACLSDVAAVGMVYSSSIGPASWGGDAGCADAVTGADQVPCASNAGRALAFLAPGVRWQTDTPGGLHTATFSGTSAAAPAAAGALLLARQARVLPDPAVAVELLRMSGVPILDGKNGRATPRLDVAAAHASADAVSGACDVSGGVSACAGDASALSGVVSSLVAALTLENGVEGHVTATLVSPDGTSVRILDQPARAGEVVRAVVGRTQSSHEPLSLFAGVRAAGTWRLQVTGATPPRVVSWALGIETRADAPATQADPSPGSTVLPAVRSAGRFGAFFTTDLRLFNSDASTSHDATLRFRPRPGDPELSVPVTLAPLQTRALEDVLGNAFRATGSATLRVEAPAAVAVAARTRTTAPRGRAFSIGEPSAAGNGVALGESPAILLPIVDAAGWRLNVGLQEVTGRPVFARVRVRAASGGTSEIFEVYVPGGGSVQLPDVLQGLDAAAAAGRLEVEVASGDGRLAPYATGLENATSDGTFAVPLEPGRVHTVPLPLDDTRLDLKLTTLQDAPTRLRLERMPADGRRPSSLIVPVGRGETRLIEDVAALFGLLGVQGGAVSVTALEGATVLVSSRLRAPADTAGASPLPITSATALSPGRRAALPFLSARSSMTITETSGLDSRARVSIYSRDGELVYTADVFLEAFQSATFGGAGATDVGGAVADGTAVLEMLSGGLLTASAVNRDPDSGDSFAIAPIPVP